MSMYVQYSVRLRKLLFKSHCLVRPYSTERAIRSIANCTLKAVLEDECIELVILCHEKGCSLC